MDGSDVKGSPAWWFEKLMQGFDARGPMQWHPLGLDQEPSALDTRKERLERLWAYYVGRAPLPQVASEYSEVFRVVMRKARSNYAPMTVNAMLNRMALTGVSTAIDNDAGGDDLAAEVAEVSNLSTTVQDLFAYVFTMSEAYGMVVPPKKGSAAKPMIVALDPRNAIGDVDPNNPHVLRALLVRTCDPMLEVETAVLFLPGSLQRAKRSLTGQPVDSLRWEWDGEPEKIVGIDHLGGIPGVRLDNANGLGEYEPHLDLLDRINDTTLQRIVVTWYQSFRQRGVIGDLEGDNDDPDAEPMTEDELKQIFSADPGSLWRVPKDVSFWESSQADLGPIINAKRDDVKEFAALTSTPLHLITPDAANQTAEGASLMREGLNHKIKDRRSRFDPKLKLLFRIAFAFAGQPDRGAKMKLQWGPLENNSLAERGSATAQTKGVLSMRRQLTEIWGMTPTEAEANITELTAERILATANAPQAPPAAQAEPDQGAVP
ncbi:phage portal protein [Nocardia sp. NPDC050697]|uniref:phage portal protein n=1 Tax=Nocardia sp. NPDC050697 TaxID=3155158 RepID=UPI0033F96DB3